MIKNISLFLFAVLSLSSKAQSDTAKEAPLTIVEKMPEFPGGEKEMMMFIQRNVNYPQAEKELGIQGVSYITLIIEKDGSINDVKVLRGVKCGPGCDIEAIRVIKSMPAWQPGMQNGRPVRVQYNLPISFTLRDVPRTDCDYAHDIGAQITAHYNAGVKFSEINEPEDAATEFTAVLKLSPNDIDALYNRGIMNMKMKRKEEACNDWNKIKSLGKPDADALINKYCK